jgi:DNA-directed RNA polymerase specialized sigma24 family protein
MNDYVKSSYDISNWDFDFTFLTDDELKSARKYLHNYLWTNFQLVDEEIVQKTILKAFNQASKYDQTKSNKFTWMASICRNIYLSKGSYSNSKRKTFSLDEEIPGGEKSGVTYVDFVVSDDEDDFEDLGTISKEIKWIVERGKYPYLRLRISGMSYEKIMEVMGVDRAVVKNRLHNERKLLKRHLNEFGSEEMKVHLKGRRRNGKR